MSDKNYERIYRIKRTLQITVLVVQIIFFSALPVVAFELSGFSVKNSTESEAEEVNVQKKDVLITGSIKGIINTGNNLSGIGIATAESVMAPWQKSSYDAEAFINGGYVDEEYAYKLISLAEDDVRVTNVLANAGLYPEELLEMLAKYPETVTFVSDYLYCRYNQVAEDVGEVEAGEIPLLLQWDKRWGYAEYGNGYIGNGGCGPTALSMVIVGLTGDTTITPKVVADYAAKNGYYVSGAGSSWTLMSEGARSFGVEGKIMSFGKDEIYRALNEGHPIICSVGAGDFTSGGHFIVLTGIKDEKICVNDPNSIINSGKLWTFEELAPQIRNLWEFTLKE